MGGVGGLGMWMLGLCMPQSSNTNSSVLEVRGEGKGYLTVVGSFI